MGEPARKLFDTLEYVKEMKAAGFTPEQAEGQARSFLKIVESHLVTIYDLKDLEMLLEEQIKALDVKLETRTKELELSIKQVESSLKRDMKALDVKLETRTKELELSVKQVESALKHDIKELDTKATTSTELIRKDMELMRRDIKIWFGGLLLTGIGGLATLITILTHF